MSPEMLHTTLVIPNWNGLEHLKVCLESVHRQTLQPSCTILVDNGSTDGSVEFVETQFPRVECIRIGHNAGFAVAVNRGIQAKRGRYVALLNNDTELDPLWLEIMVAALERDRSAGMAACKMLRFERRDIIDGAGDGLTRGGAPYTRGAGEPDDGRFNAPGRVFGACAGAAVYRTELFDRIGLFDEAFVSYYEDCDLSVRACLAGWHCLYVPEARCYHKRGASSIRQPAYPIRMQERNLTALQVKNFPLSVWITKGPVIVASRIRRTYRSVAAGMGKATFLGLLDSLPLLPRMLAQRRLIQRSRTVPAKALAQWMGK
jgi:GT2 family glycosyltransferase